MLCNRLMSTESWEWNVNSRENTSLLLPGIRQRHPRPTKPPNPRAAQPLYGTCGLCNLPWENKENNEATSAGKAGVFTTRRPDPGARAAAVTLPAASPGQAGLPAPRTSRPKLRTPFPAPGKAESFSNLRSLSGAERARAAEPSAHPTA